MLRRILLAACVCFTALFGCSATTTPDSAGVSEPSRVAQSDAQERLVTLLFTNDLESAYDPTPAYWREDMTSIGGIAELSTLIEDYRETDAPVFLFDAGDIFTGTLAQLTGGEIAFELMRLMGYDAMGIGNHEFEFGWQEFARQKKRASFPVLGANLTYRDSGEPYAQAYAVIERQGIRIGVIGVLGEDAATALIPSNLAGVRVSNPIVAVKKYVSELRESVDLVVVLTHQGPTAPMQTNDEAVPEVYRGNAANLALAAAVPGIDVILAGHTDAGTPEALRDEVNGTLIMQTWGQGQHLGVLKLLLSARSGAATLVSSALVPVNSEALEPHPKVAARLQDYRDQHPEIFTEVGQLDEIASREYYRESRLGNLLADIVRVQADADIGLMPSGALRKDLPKGMLRRVDLQDMFPFEDRVALVELSGRTLIEVIEQGLSLERGLLQVSGLQVECAMTAPLGQRLVSLRVGRDVVDPKAVYRVATLEILAEGGDSYKQFLDAKSVSLSDSHFSAALLRHFSGKGSQSTSVPQIGRYDCQY